MSAILLKLKTWWETAEKTQKYMTFGGIGFLAIMFIGIFVYASSPKYALLYSGLSDADKNNVVTEIQTMGIPVKYDTPGAVEVPQNKIQDIRMHLAGTGKMPKSSAYAGLGELDKINLMTTPAQEKERLKSALEGELAKSIESLDGVSSVRVHLTLPDTTPFVENRRASTAAVSITETPGKTLTPSQGRAIAALVANSCDGMDITNVSVLNQKMELIFNGKDSESNNMVASSKQALEDKIAKQRQEQIQQVLDRIYGPGMTVATVRAEVDMDKRQEEITADKPTLDKPLVAESTSETMPVTGSGVGDATGMNANTGAGAGGPATGNGTKDAKGNYVSERKINTVPMTRTISKIERSTGDLKSLSISVVANIAPNATNDPNSDITNELAKPGGLDKVVEILKAEVAPLQARNRATFPDPTVTGVVFDTTSTKKAEAEMDAAKGQQRTQQIISLLPIAALILVGMVVMKQVGKMTGTTKTLVVQEQGGDFASALSEGGSAQPGTPGFEAGPEVNAAMLAGPESDAVASAMAMALPDLMVDPIPDKISVPLEQIKKMAKDRPEVVATLMKSMILEEKR